MKAEKSRNSQKRRLFKNTKETEKIHMKGIVGRQTSGEHQPSRQGLEGRNVTGCHKMPQTAKYYNWLTQAATNNRPNIHSDPSIKSDWGQQCF